MHATPVRAAFFQRLDAVESSAHDRKFDVGVVDLLLKVRPLAIYSGVRVEVLTGPAIPFFGYAPGGPQGGHGAGDGAVFHIEEGLNCAGVRSVSPGEQRDRERE